MNEDNKKIEKKQEPIVIEETKEEPKKEKLVPTEEINKKKTVLLVLLFIFLFAFIIFMPDVNEMIDNIKKETGMSKIEKQAKQIEEYQNQKEKEKENNKTIKTEKLDTIICTKTAIALKDYDQTTVETFKYNSKKQVKESSIKTTYTFKEQNQTYQTLKTECTEDSLKYVDKKGYETACSYSETEVVIENTFDLSTFKTIKDKSKVIEANAKLNDNIDSIKTKLTSEGYTCG